MNTGFVKKVILPLISIATIVLVMVFSLMIPSGSSSVFAQEPTQWNDGIKRTSTPTPPNYTPPNNTVRGESGCGSNCVPPGEPTLPPPPPKVCAINRLNIRSGPGIEYKAIGIFPVGACADFISDNGPYLKISYTVGDRTIVGYVAEHNPDFPSQDYLTTPTPSL